MKRAGIFNPYWDTLGGGEKYVATAAKVMVHEGYRVDLYWHEPEILTDIYKRYGYDLSGVEVKPEGYEAFMHGSLWDRWRLTREYQLFFYVSDGSFPFLFAKNNLVHFQVPFSRIKIQPWLQSIKRRLIRAVVCNSRFTKQVIDRTYGLDSRVVYPPAAMIAAAKKQLFILSVGRFDNLMHSKRQDLLIAAFEKLKVKGWKLILAGGVLHGEEEVERLRGLIKGMAIELVINPGWKQLADLYAKASIFWHAAGYGLDLEKQPEKAEHFGIATVEAMSAGAVPVVFKGGGQPEIITHGKTGFLWETEKEMLDVTRTLVSKTTLLTAMSKKAQTRSRDFSEEIFEREFTQLIG